MMAVLVGASKWSAPLLLAEPWGYRGPMVGWNGVGGGGRSNRIRRRTLQQRGILASDEGGTVKITNIETLIVSSGPGKKNFCFVVVDTDEGIWGVGESGLSSRELAVQGAVEHLKRFLVGKNPFQ